MDVSRAGPGESRDGGLSRRYCKLCDIADFADPGLLAMARDLLPKRDPTTHIERKVWEFAMCAMFLDEVGRLEESTEALGVGAGDERILFWLANRIGRVVATDIYGEGGFAGREAGRSMLEDPAAYAPFPYRARTTSPGPPRRSGACSPGRARLPGHRVLRRPASTRPRRRGGGRPRGDPGPAQAACHAAPAPRAGGLHRGGADAASREAVGPGAQQPIETALSPASWDNLTRIDRRTKQLVPRSGGFYPHILLRASRSVFTSVGLALQKPL